MTFFGDCSTSTREGREEGEKGNRKANQLTLWSIIVVVVVVEEVFVVSNSNLLSLFNDYMKMFLFF